MARQKNDGRGRLGGRVAGTPNKEKPLKETLRTYSEEYYHKVNTETGITAFQEDLLALSPSERLDVELKMLRFHLPQMSSVTAEMNVVDNSLLSERLSQLIDE